MRDKQMEQAERGIARAAKRLREAQAVREHRAELEREARAEQAFELLAAFGLGVEVVNVLTGERHWT